MHPSSHLHRQFLRRFGALMVSGALVASFAGLAASPASAATTTVGPIDFESGYTAGNVNGQNGWSKTGPYDVAVAEVDAFADAAGYGFGEMALRASNAVTSGSFGDQAFSPGLAQVAGEGAGAPYFTASFSIGTTKSVQQPGLALSVSPDDGNGGRMSYLRFNDQTDGVHVVFVDVADQGPLGTVATFNPDVPIGTLDRATSHSIRFEIAFVDGPGGADGVGNDVVKIFVDGVLEHTGTTWENYYRYDPEQAGNANAIPTTSKLLFRAGGTLAAANLGQGYLIDGVRLSSSTTAPVVTPPKVEGANYDGNKTCSDINPAWKEFKIEGAPDDGIHDDPNSDLVITISNSSAQTFDWSSNQDISAVLVKGGRGGGGVKYVYSGANDLADTGLHALLHDAAKNPPYYDISHVNFCYKVGGDTQPPVDEPVTPNPNPGNGNPNPGNPNAANPNAVNPQTAGKPGTTVLGETLVNDGTLPRTGGAATPTLALTGGLGLVFGLALLVLGYRKPAVEST